MTRTGALTIFRRARRPRSRRERDVRAITLAATLAAGAGRTYEVGGPYLAGDAATGTVTRITAGNGGYTVHNDQGGWLFLAAHYVARPRP